MKILLALLVCVAACGSKNPYACTSDSQCTQKGIGGVCAPEGFCAFPDSTCAGGYRFESGAGNDLANTCAVAAIDAPVDPTCGGIGQTCCAGNTCNEGGCNGGTCEACVTDVAFGRRFSCVLKAAGTVWCSGENVNGQLGFGLPGVPSATPQQVRDVGTDTIMDATAIGLGRQHACAIRSGGSVWCWGANESGELGNGTSNQSAAAVRVIKTDDTPLTGMVEVKAGYNHTCARDGTNGQIFCWGYNGEGDLGDGTTVTRSKAAPVLVAPMGAPFSGAVDLQIGGGHGCVRKANNEMWCWGKNNDGELGDTTNAHKMVPVRSGDARAIATSLWSTCRVNLDSTISCHGWGRGAAFGLGAEDGFQQGPNRLMPVQALVAPGGAPVTGAVKLSAGSGTCAIMSDTSVQCTGDGQYGQNGTGMPRRVFTPVKRADGTPLTGVDRLVGKWPHQCAHQTNGAWVCWGRNSIGELGDGSFVNRGFPTTLKASCP